MHIDYEKSVEIVNKIHLECYPPWLCSSPPSRSLENYFQINDDGNFLQILNLFQSVINVPDLNGETTIFHVSRAFALFN